jgi:hypothetical protein
VLPGPDLQGSHLLAYEDNFGNLRTRFELTDLNVQDEPRGHVSRAIQEILQEEL